MKATAEPLRLDRNGATLAGVGSLSAADSHDVQWKAPDASVTNLGFEGGYDLLFAAVGTSEHVAILASRDSPEVYTLDASHGAHHRLELRLTRFNDPVGGLRYIKFVELPSGFLLLYEYGVACFDNIGWLRWHVRHYRVDWWFDHIDPQAVWLHEQEGPEDDPQHPRLIGYQLADGARVPL
jgi:hypothetical protein